MKNTGSSSVTMAVARIVVGVMFLFFAQYKLMGHDFAHGGYAKYVTGYVQESAVPAYKPFLRATLKYPTASGYAVGVAELLIGLSMVLGFWVRPLPLLVLYSWPTCCFPPGCFRKAFRHGDILATSWIILDSCCCFWFFCSQCGYHFGARQGKIRTHGQFAT